MYERKHLKRMERRHYEKFFAEFKEFISRGNVVDLAVGMIIGSAFTAIVKSLVENIVTPLIGVLLGGLDLSGPELHDRQRCHRDRPDL